MVAEITRMARDGKVLIPKSLRDKLNLRGGEPMIIVEVDGRIVLSPASGSSVRSEFRSIAEEFDRRLTKVDHGIDPVELVRQLREN